MTDEDIRRQKGDALLVHREAKERAAHVRQRVRDIGAGIRTLGARLETTPEDFFPAHKMTDEQGKTIRRLQSAVMPTAEVGTIVNLDSIMVLAEELREAEYAVSEAAKNAVNLGVP